MKNKKKKTNLINGIMLIIVIAISLFVVQRIEKRYIAPSRNNFLAVNTATWDTNKVTVYTDSNGAVVPIPKGYVVSSVSGENVVKNGLVIYEGTASVTSAPISGSSVLSSAQGTRNQWVWVPVADVSRIYSETNGVKTAKLWNFTSTGRTSWSTSVYEPLLLPGIDVENNFARYNFHAESTEQLYQRIQLEFEETINSIKKYGGFYIGRYETGNLSQKVPTVKRINLDIVNQTWYTMYNKSSLLGANSNVKTGMIYGSLWDETLQWIIESGGKTQSQVAVDSKEWGNYVNVSFTYTSTSGSVSTKSSGTASGIPAGGSDRNKANNIYDMAGNLFEWTVEATTAKNGRSLRGGYFSDDASVGHRPAASRNDAPITSTFGNVGTRYYLYIK